MRKLNFFSFWAGISLLLVSTSGCVVLLPLVEADSQATSGKTELADGSETAAPGPRARLLASERKNRQRSRRLSSLANANLPSLLADLESPEAVVRVHAAYWLGEMGGEAKPAVPRLVANLRHSDRWVRRSSAKALGKIGGKDAEGALQFASADRDKFVAESARNALKKISSRRVSKYTYAN